MAECQRHHANGFARNEPGGAEVPETPRGRKAAPRERREAAKRRTRERVGSLRAKPSDQY